MSSSIVGGTKTRILEAAKEIFVKNGFSGTSMAMVAKHAAVNHSLIFHHFGSKEGLWIAVKMRIVEEANARESVLPSTTLPFSEFLETLIERSIRFYRENSDIVQLINWQRIEKDVGENIGVTQSQETMKWIEAFKHYQTTGEVDPLLEPQFILTIVASTAYSIATDRSVFMNREGSEKAYVKFCSKVLTKGLNPGSFDK